MVYFGEAKLGFRSAILVFGVIILGLIMADCGSAKISCSGNCVIIMDDVQKS